jgi:hypothetical protein
VIDGVDGSSGEPPGPGTYFCMSPDHVSNSGSVSVNVRKENKGNRRPDIQ